jgi:hypothetical protein
MRTVGAYTCAMKLREVNLSDLHWHFDAETLSVIVRACEDGHWTTILAYLTLEMVEYTIFTPESVLSNWIWNVSRHCIGFDGSPEPLFVKSE